MIITITFPACWVHIDNDLHYLQTVFADGQCLTSVPVPEKDVLTARSYGYGDDWMRLWREHDLLHHWLGFLFGQQHSPTIWSECHPDHPVALAPWARQQEEDFVAHVHRWLNRGVWVPDLWPLQNSGLNLDELRDWTMSVLSYQTSIISYEWLASVRQPKFADSVH